MKLIVNELGITYEDVGSGPTVLMLHGWKDNLHTFDEVAGALSRNHRVVRLDLPGFGGSESPKNTWRVSDYVMFVRDFIAKLQLDVTTLVGHSFGGRITIKGVGEGELNPRRVILIASAGIIRNRSWRNHFLRAFAKIGRAVTVIPPLNFWRDNLRRKLYTAIGSDYFAAGALKEIFVAVVSEDLSAYARRIEVPTLIVWGKDDTTTPLEQGERINSLIPNSRLEILEGAGHFVHKERPEEVARLIQSFI